MDEYDFNFEPLTRPNLNWIDPALKQRLSSEKDFDQELIPEFLIAGKETLLFKEETFEISKPVSDLFELSW